jgi:hypothetical protein
MNIFNRKAGHIYLANVRGTGFYKVGFTKDNPEARVRQLQTSNPLPIDLVDSYHSRSARAEEQFLHRLLWEYRTGGGTEWFDLPEDAVRIIHAVFSLPGCIAVSARKNVQTLSFLYKVFEVFALNELNDRDGDLPW